jgi:hypothetical protein
MQYAQICVMGERVKKSRAKTKKRNRRKKEKRAGTSPSMVQYEAQ